jgi:hypothetical protein
MKTAEEILYQFRIVPTEQRVALLKLILGLKKSPFSVQDLNDGMHAVDLAVSHNTLVTTLLLFVTRKVLRAFPAPKAEKKKGRPITLYVIDPSLAFAASNAQSRISTSDPEQAKGTDFPVNVPASLKNKPDNF